MVVKFAKTNQYGDAKIPTKREEDAGYDIYPHFKDDFIMIPAHKTVMIPTGIASVIPSGHYFQLEERGSTGSLGIKRSAGVIDSGYRGEWFVAITNANAEDLYIAKANIREELKYAANILKKEIIVYPYEKAIAQAVLHEIPSVEVEECTFDEVRQILSERGDGKLGSSDKK